jgi:hypothetical protein
MNDSTEHAGARAVDDRCLAKDWQPAARLLFLVRAVGELWEVSIGDSSDAIRYRAKEEAIEAAERAAQRHWRRRHESTGVRVDDELIAHACFGN